MFAEIIAQTGGLIAVGALTYALTRSFRFDVNQPSIPDPMRSALSSVVAILAGGLIIGSLFLLVHLAGTRPTDASDVSHMRFGFSQVTNQTIFAFLMVAPALVIIRKRKESLSSLGISKRNVRGSILIGLLPAVLGIPIMMFSSSVSLSNFFGRVGTEHLWGLFYYSIVGCSEEFLFRGYLQTRLVPWIGTWQGWVVASIVMALYHLPQRMLIQGLSFPDSLSSSAALVPISLFLGYLMLRTQNILAPAIFHTFADWLGTLSS